MNHSLYTPLLVYIFYKQLQMIPLKTTQFHIATIITYRKLSYIIGDCLAQKRHLFVMVYWRLVWY